MEYVIFFTTAAIAVIGGLGMLLDRNAVHSALFLLLNIGAISVLFLLLQSPFLFAIQLAIYAGAIMVLFLFVVMLLGSERVEDKPDKLAWQSILALGLGVLLLVEAIAINAYLPAGPPSEEAIEGMEAISDPAAIGAELFTTYLLPFEVTGILLLVGIIGVVVLHQQSREAHGDEASIPEPTTSSGVVKVKGE